jgi:glycosyltransferase involved in cell wall biosynthesis
VRTVASQAGTVVTPNDPQDLARAMMEYFSPELDQDAWQHAARDIAVEKYAWSAIVERLEGLYNQLILK